MNLGRSSIGMYGIPISDSFTERNYVGVIVHAKIGNLRSINDRLGYLGGNQALEQLQQALIRAMPIQGTVSKHAGNGFLCLCTSWSIDLAIKYIEHVTKVLGVCLPQVELHFGYARLLEGSSDIEISNQKVIAEKASWLAKKKGVRFCSANDGDLVESVYWLRQIDRLFRDEKFKLVFQSVVNLSTGAEVYKEALLRIIDERGNLLPPQTMLQAAEESYDIRRIDLWVFSTIIDMFLNGSIDFDVAVNISAITLSDASLVKIISEKIKNSGFADRIAVEITETAMMKNYTEVKRNILALKSVGVRIAIDDFGVGFTSFKTILDLPIDTIKVDGLFITGIECDERKHALISGLRVMTEAMNFKIVAERIETESQLDVCRSLGIDYGQGFYFAVPA